jgi:hypothetical protein
MALKPMSRAAVCDSLEDIGMGRSVVVFEEPRGQRPQPVARLDRTPAQQDPVLPPRPPHRYYPGIWAPNAPSPAALTA